MATSGKHRAPNRRRHGKDSRSRVVARRGLLGAAIVGCGLVVQYFPETSSRSLSADVSDVRGRDLSAATASRDFARPPLVSTAGPTAAASASAVATDPPAAPLPVVGPLIDWNAIARAKKYIGARGEWAHMCLAFVRTTFGLPSVQSTASEAWSAAKHKHRNDRNPPAGVPVFWSGGSSGDGHVAFSLGNGSIISTDLPYTGHISQTHLSAIQSAWGLRYLGWTEDLEGVRIYTP